MRLLIYQLLISLCLWYTAHSASNLKVNGNQMFGDTFRLECSTSTSNTLNFGTFYRSTNSGQLGILVGYREFHPNLTPSCRERRETVTNYTVSCDSDGSMFTLTILANNTIEHNTYWRCGTTEDSSVLDNNVISIAIVVKITGISWVSTVLGRNNTVNVTSDEPTTFQCQTTQGRPAANITWYLDNAPQSGGTTTTTPISGDIVITTGYLTLTVNMTADDKVLSCRATNYVNMKPVESTVKPVIRVKYAPSGPPVIVKYINGTIYTTRIGSSQAVTCHVPTAYPVPTLSWSCPSYTVTRTTPLLGYTDVVSSSITWTASSTDPGQTCQCTSYQEISGTATTYINIDFLCGPITESLEAATGRNNGRTTLNVAFYSNDDTVPNVTWGKSSRQIALNITDTRFESSVNVRNVTLTMYEHSITDQPGFIGRLTVHTITQEDFTNYSCQISNTIGSTTVLLPDGPPDPPRQLRTTITDYSITLFWLSGFHGGADQTFTVEYRTTTEMMFKVAAVISGGQKEGVQFITTVQELPPDTEYVIQITCSNRFGQQKETRCVEARAAPAPLSVSTSKSTSSIGPAVGGTIGGLLGVVLLGLIVYRLKRRVLDKSSNTAMRNTAADGHRVYDTLQITSGASPYQTIELNDSSPSGVYVNLEL